MFLRTKRILLNAVDTGGASGNVAPQPAASNSEVVPQAQGDTVTITKADLEALVASSVTKAVGEVKGSIYAEARRTFTEAKSTKAKPDDAAPTVTSNVSAQPDPFKMRHLDFALTRLGISPALSQTQYERAHRDFASDSPGDAEAWAKDYFHGHAALAQVIQPVTQPQAAHTAKPVADHPVSNRGAPPPAQVPIDELDLFTASDSDRAAYIKAKGPKAYVAQLQKQAKGRPVRLG